MKLRLIAFTCLCAGLMAACSKNNSTPNNQNPTPAPAPTNVIDAAGLLGKWEATSSYIVIYDKTGTIKEEYGVSQTYKGGDVAWHDIYKTFMTFNADNTYKHEDKDGNPDGMVLKNMFPKTGSWKLKNDNKVITLQTYKTFGGDSLFDYQVIEYKNTYMHLTYTDTVFNPNEKQVHHLEFKK